MIESFKRREQAKTKAEISLSYNTARLTAEFVCLGLNGKHLPSLYDTFPALVDQTSLEQQEKQQAYAESMRYKIRFMEMASAHNKKFSKGGAET